MKPLLLSCLVLAATLATLQHNVACQEEAPAVPTTTLAPASSEEPKPVEEQPTSTQVPTAVETTTSPAEPATEEKKSEESKPTEEKPKEEEKDKKDDDDDKDDDKPADGKEKEEKPKEDGEMESPVAPGPQQQPKIIFVQQHVRDPATGVIYTRQVPLIPSNFLRPMPYEPRGQPPPPMQAPEPRPQESAGPYDPLGQFSAAQKKRQFFQDMLMSQLVKFESEIEPMLEREDNVTEKNDIEEMLGGVGELKRTLEGHQIFNITELMNNWKQGRLGSQQGDQQPGESSVQPQGPPMPNYRPRQPQQQPQMTVRTLILVPHQRGPMGPPQQQPQRFDPYAQMNRQIPLIHLHQRRGSPAGYQQPLEAPQNHHQQLGGEGPQEQIEPQAAPSEEYSNNNDIFGY